VDRIHKLFYPDRWDDCSYGAFSCRSSYLLRIKDSATLCERSRLVVSVALYSGTPGSGKSLNVTRKILLALWSGRDVISNYPIRFTQKEIKRGYQDRFYYVPEDRITVPNLMQFAQVKGYLDKKEESQCLVVIDEAGGRFNCREYGKSDRMEWVKFFSQHRKFGFDVTLVAQNARMLDRQIRSMVELEYKHRKAQNMYWWLKLSPWKLFVAVEYFYGLKMKTDVQFFTYTKNIGERYDSMKLFEEFDIPVFGNQDGIDCRAIFAS
jgi:zona occludens toxin